MPESVPDYVAGGQYTEDKRPDYAPAGPGVSGNWTWNAARGRWEWRKGAATPGGQAPPTNLNPVSAFGNLGIRGGPSTESSKAAWEAIAVQNEAASRPNPFGNETFGVTQQYTPFGLAQPSAFGAYGGGFGGFGRGYSYGTDQLVPSLEQRRTGMMSQMFLGGGR